MTVPEVPIPIAGTDFYPSTFQESETDRRANLKDFGYYVDLCLLGRHRARPYRMVGSDGSAQ